MRQLGNVSIPRAGLIGCAHALDRWAVYAVCHVSFFQEIDVLYSKTLMLLTLGAVAHVAWALESPIVGPRALGMGGVGVACSDDYVAQFYNPAAFGFFAAGEANGERSASDNNNLQRKDWGMGIDATVGVHLVGNLGTYLNDVLQIDVNKLQAIGQTGNVDTATLTNLTKVLAALSSFDADADAVIVDFNAGFGLRIGHFGLGVRSFGQAVGKLEDFDRTHIGITLPAGQSVAAQINNVSVPVNTTPGTYNPTKLNATQQATLLGILINNGQVSAATAQQAVNKLDYSLAEAGINANDIDGVIAQMAQLVQSSAVGNLKFGTNDSKLRMIGLGVVEIPVTYGYAFDEHWSIGGSLKYMMGRVYGLDIPLFNTNGDDLSQSFSNSRNNYQQSSNMGIDLSVMTRFPMVQVGLTGRNLNGPSFKGPTVNGVQFATQYIKPSATAGIAFIPFTTVTLAADMDLTRSDSVLKSRNYQRIAGGFEWDAFRFLALRAGISKNLAISTDPTLYSGGVGLNLWLLRIDLAAQATTETVTYDGKDYPKEARASFAVATDW